MLELLAGMGDVILNSVAIEWGKSRDKNGPVRRPDYPTSHATKVDLIKKVQHIFAACEC